MEIHRERDEELFKAFKKAYSRKGVTYEEAIREAVNSPCSRYWVSPDYVYREVLARLKGYNWNKRRKQVRGIREKAYKDLYERFLVLSQRREFKGCSTRFISSFLVVHPAPSFFLSVRRAADIISRMRNGNNNSNNSNSGHNHPTL